MASDNQFAPVWYMTGKSGMEISYPDRDERQTYPQIRAFFNFAGGKFSASGRKQAGVTAEMWGTAKNGKPVLRISSSSEPETGDWQTAISVSGYWQFSDGKWNLRSYTSDESMALAEVLADHIRRSDRPDVSQTNEWLEQRCALQVFHAMRSLGFPESAKDFMEHKAPAVPKRTQAKPRTPAPKPRKAKSVASEPSKPKKTAAKPAKRASAAKSKSAPRTKKTARTELSANAKAPPASPPEPEAPSETIETPPIFQPMT